jgi:hypothetical protein
MADKFDEFLEEVENDIRNERLSKLWAKYGKIVSAAVVGAVLLSAGWVLYNNHHKKQISLNSEMLLKASDLLSAGKMEEAIGVLDHITHDSNPPYGEMAQMVKASTLISKGGEDVVRGKEILSIIVKKSHIDPVIRDLAEFSLIKADADLINFNSPNEDEMAKINGLIERLTPLTADKHPWRFQAMDLKGFLLFKTKRFTEASEIYVAIAQAEKCPKGITARAEIMSQLILSETPAS